MYIDIIEPLGAIVIKLRARTWERGGEAVAWLRSNPPAGYRVRYVGFRPTTSSGRRCDVVVELDYVDDREKQLLTHYEARANVSLILFASMARSRLGLLSTSPTTTPTSIPGNASEGPSPSE